MKKQLLLAVGAVVALTACGGDTPKQSTDDRTKEQLIERISALEEENRQLKAELENNNQVLNTKPVEATETAEETVAETEPPTVETPPETTTGIVQKVQSQPGTTQSDNYFVLDAKRHTYTQTGDAFVVKSTYSDDDILVIPIQFTNKDDDPTDPWISFAFDFTAKQEDDTQEYTLSGGQGGVPDEYSNDISMQVKKGATVDYYLLFTLEQGFTDVFMTDTWGREKLLTLQF